MLILFLQYIHTIVSDDEEDNSGGERQLKHHGIWNTMSLDELIPDDDPSDVISVCPVDLCTDVLPAKLSEPLASMVDRAKSLIRKHGTRDTLEFFKLSMEICGALKNVHAHEEHIRRAHRWGWPTHISWDDLPGRIMAIKNDILDLIYDPAARAKSVVHQRFLEQLDKAGLGRDYMKLAKGQAAPMAIYCQSRPG